MNKIIDKASIENILNRIRPIGDNGQKLEIKSETPYQTAFIQKSFKLEQDLKWGTNTVPHTNEVLEFLGDGFISAVVGKYLMDRFPDEHEGFLTKMRSRLIRASTLYSFARFLRLNEFLLLGEMEERLTFVGSNKGRNNPRFYEDCFEAFVGAIIQDHGDEDGYRYAKRFVVAIIEHTIVFSDLILHNENHKDRLLRFFKTQTEPDDPTKRWPVPSYTDFSQGTVKIQGIFLTDKRLRTLPLFVQDKVLKYHNDQLMDVHTNIRQKIERHAAQTHSWLIGFASESKRSLAEQEASSQALFCLCVPPAFQ